MTILITGGAGFIGSNLIASLNDDGIDDIVVVDTMTHKDQWKNLVKRRFSRLISIDASERANDDPACNIARPECIIHLAAITDTSATDAHRTLMVNNYWSRSLLETAQQQNIPFIYASSAAVYGDGTKGFSEPTTDLRPLNLYGWSKLLFDRHVQRQSASTRVTGLRFFNVYGPNEYHKGKMASVLAQQYGLQPRVMLFGASPRRDFVYVEDVVKTIRWFMDHPNIPGIFNVGTGEARKFDDLFGYDGVPEIEYFWPSGNQDTYQSFTQADLALLRRVGCDVQFRSIKDGVRDYVEKYLSRHDRYR